MNINFEKMLFYNDLAEYQCSVEGKRLDAGFKNNVSNLEELIDDYYSKRNGAGLTYDNLDEKKEGKEFDLYIARMYHELN